MTLKPLHWVRRSARVWECKVLAEYSLTIMEQGRTSPLFRFRNGSYPNLEQAKQAALAFLTAELSPLLSDPDQPHLQRAA